MDATRITLALKIFICLLLMDKSCSQQESSSPSNTTCPKNCECSFCTTPAISDHIALRCNHTGPWSITGLASTDKICSLDLSRSSLPNISHMVLGNMSNTRNLTLSYNLIEEIPAKYWKGFQALQYLFLDHNSIKVITEDTFDGLEELTYLNLAYNNIRQWHGILSTSLPNLQTLNVKENNNFNQFKIQTLLKNTRLKAIVGATTSKDCIQCNYSRTKVPRKLLIQLKGCQFIPEENMPLIEQFRSKYLYFRGECKTKTCQLNFVNLPEVKKIYKNHCWDVARSIRSIEYCLGVVAILLNLIVLITILSTRSLVSKTSMFLTSHLAFGDIIMGVFSLTIANGHGIMTDKGIRLWRQDQCPYFRSLLVLGQTIEALTSLVMTVERYLVIVYCMKPHVRVTPKIAYLLCIAINVFGIVSCIGIQSFDKFIRDNFMCVLVQNFRTTRRLLVTQVLMLSFVGSYLFVAGMYIHIYFFVRRTAQHAGIKRETRLAKRISIVVFSNMIFYAIPNLCIVIFTAAGVNILTSDRDTNFILRTWLPPMCMVVNACLNPFLFAFRNNEFLKKLKQNTKLILGPLISGKKLPLNLNPGNSYALSTFAHAQTASQTTLTETFELRAA